jgi:hypothetical protein
MEPGKRFPTHLQTTKPETMSQPNMPLKIVLPDLAAFELLTEAVQFAAHNAIESKQRADYAHMLAYVLSQKDPVHNSIQINYTMP